jgi:hypothetical protein
VGIAAGSVAAQSYSSSEEPAEFTPLNRRVESSDLTPVQLPGDLWRGLDGAAVGKWLAAQDALPRSPALAEMWRRLLLSAAAPPAGPQGGEDLLRLRLEALYRAGLVSEIGEALAKIGTPGPVAKLWQARIDIGMGTRAKACQALAGLAEPKLSKPQRAEAQMLSGYCAAVAGDTSGGALAASLAREEGSTADLALTILETLDGGVERKPALPAHLSLIDYRFLELTGPIDGAQALQRAEPALVVALARSSALAIKLQVAAAERALHMNALSPEAVAEVYRRLPLPEPAAEGADPVLRRAKLFRALEESQAPAVRARLARTLLEEARRAGVEMQTARMLGPVFSNLWPAPGSEPMAEPAVEIALAGGQLDLARRWAESAASLQHWLALIDLADPEVRKLSQSGLAYLDDLARRGRLPPAALSRVVTVLDALKIDVPLPLWEAAGKVGQPAGGYLPPTGVLGELEQTSQRKEAGHTIILVIEALGPEGPDGTNILALGDSLRALKRAGLEADARRLAVEALFGVWPRTSGG